MEGFGGIVDYTGIKVGAEFIRHVICILGG